jgi:uncharacterized protein
VIIIYGPRQAGKTTLVKQLLSRHGNLKNYYNCDEADIRAQLQNTTSTKLRALFGDERLIVIDEAQRVPNI